MNLLLDTNAFLWMAATPDRLPKKIHDLWRDPKNTLTLSAVSACEIAIKYHLHKLPLPEPPSFFVPKERMAHGILSLSLDEESSLLLESLPPIHQDPFDRLLICQALANDLIILTPDRSIRQYEVKTMW